MATSQTKQPTNQERVKKMNKFTVIAKKASCWEVVDGKQKRISKARFDALMAQKVVKTEKRENETVYHVEEREEVELLSFTELHEDVQNRIIAENQYILVEDADWFENVKSSFTETLELLGFTNIQSNFAGFGSQGDGASFTGVWYARNMVNNPEKWQSLREFGHFKPIINKLLKMGGSAQIKRNSSRYAHEYTCFVQVEGDENPERESTLERLRLECCAKYYRNLEDEYDYLTSDGVIRAYFLSCDWLRYHKNGLCVND